MKRKLAFLGAILLAAFIFTYEGNTYQTHALDEEDQAWIEEARGALQNIVEDREVMALVYLCDDLTICGSGGRRHKSGHRAQWTDGGDPGCDGG